MRRVVVLFVGILSLVRATPFDLDSVDRPTPFRYTFRVEKVEFGNDALSEDSGHNDDYGIDTFEPDEDSNLIDESDEAGPFQGLVDLFGDLQGCKLMDLLHPPKEGCAYASSGNIYLIHVLSAVNIEDVRKALDEAGIEQCEVGEEGFNDIPEGGCFWIDGDIKTLHLIGYYDDDDSQDEDIKDVIENLEMCDVTMSEIPEEGCVLIEEDRIHFINVLNEDNNADARKALSELNLTECTFDQGPVDLSAHPCYEINEEINTISFWGFPDPLKPGQDDDDDNDDEDNVDDVDDVDDDDVDDDDDDDDDYDYDYDDDEYSEKMYDTPDGEVSLPPLVRTATGRGNFQHLKLKGLFNKRSPVSKKVKAVLPENIPYRKQHQEVQNKLGRRGHQHGRKGHQYGRKGHQHGRKGHQHGRRGRQDGRYANNGSRVNHRPKWMKYPHKKA